MLCKRLRLPLMCLFSLSLLWCSLVNPQTRSSLTVLPGLSAVVSTGSLQLDRAMGVLKCSLTLNYLSRTSVLRNPACWELKGTAVGYYYYFYFSQIKRKMWLGWVENVCYQLWKYILICLCWSIFFPRGGLCSEGKALVDVGYFLSLPVDFSFTMGEDFAGTQAGTLQHCAQYLLVGVLQMFSPASGCFAFHCSWDVNQLIQQTVSLQNMYFSCKLNSRVDLRRACFHLVRHLFFLWEQQWKFPST